MSDFFKRYDHIEFERQGRILTVRLNRPEAMNAANAALHTELSRLFADLDDDPDSDVIVLTGNGRAFSAGGDLDWMQDAIDEPERFHVTIREAKRILVGQLSMEKPIIARVNGHAMGLGASLAVSCDVAIAADTAKIGDPHVAVGLVAADGGALLWPQMTGYLRAREYLLTGDAIPATKAADIGLLTDAVPTEDLDARVYGLAERLVAGKTNAIRWTKIAINRPLVALAAHHADAAFADEIRSNETAEHAEAVRAFAEGKQGKA
ncbi:enoyl-CoA hydratase/isomerase family protein [Maritimibacter sp. DP07]|uniref:Enoyl-CoA hydratase/isomerase family protein n=1 Tax=Maritimibacter harenae TaxID=2606218 RepID=A0A845M989_9RHOB|nr:enoyl-CoA hydratase/isomerase family protein [Maritimibacter harenae]MZR14577.1 enoyl-CoA hydratase/isomerase family protein [Maritimibacter harenae]